MIKLINSRLALLVATGITLFLCISLYINSREISHSQETVFSLEKQVQQAHEEEAQLEKQAQATQDTSLQEKIIRDQLLMERPGEYVIQLPELPIKGGILPSPTPSPSAWEAWQELLFAPQN